MKLLQSSFKKIPNTVILVMVSTVRLMIMSFPTKRYWKWLSCVEKCWKRFKSRVHRKIRTERFVRKWLEKKLSTNNDVWWAWVWDWICWLWALIVRKRMNLRDWSLYYWLVSRAGTSGTTQSTLNPSKRSAFVCSVCTNDL